MAAPREPLEIHSKEFIRMMRKWGWAFVTDGVKEAHMKYGSTKIKVRRNVKMNGDIAFEVARVHGISVEKFLEGPPPADKATEPVTPEPRPSRELAESQKKFEPLPVKVGSDGFITLEEALALRDLKPNVLSRSSCELIAVLSKGDAVNEQGKATRILWEQMKSVNTEEKHLQPTALTMLLKHWEAAGLIWRETNGKRTYKIGLSLPVKLTPDQEKEYLYEPEPMPKVTVEPHVHTFIGRPSACESCGFLKALLPPEELRKYGPDPEPVIKAEVVADSSSTAIAVLEAAIADHEAAITNLKFAIKILQDN